MKRSRPSCVRPGFSFIEMMIAVTILGIGAAIVVPLYGGTPEVRLTAATRKVMADLEYAQMLAVATRSPVYVRCAADRYEVCRLANGTLTPIAHPVEKSSFVVRFGAAASAPSLRNVTMSVPLFGPANDRVVAFDAGGQPFAYGEALNVATPIATRSTLTLSDGGLSKVVYIEALTGELHLP